MSDFSPQFLYRRETVRNQLPLKAVVDRVEEAFRLEGEGKTQMPAKNYLLFDQFDGDLRSMSAFIPDFNLATVKIVNSHPHNPDRHNLPTVMALVVAVNPETGFPTAVLDGTELTALRTAAASSVATDLFSPPNVSVLGIIGAGAQAEYQVEGQLIARSFDEVLVYDVDEDRARSVCESLSHQYPEISFRRVDSIKFLMESSNVVNSLTPVSSPLIEEVPTRSINHINAMGADGPGKQEWPLSVLKDIHVYVDDWEQASHSGEIHTALEEGILKKDDVAGTLGEALLSPDPPAGQITLFDSTGLAIQDTAGTKALLEANIEPDGEFSFF